MIEINMEDMKDVGVKVTGKRCFITLTTAKGEKIEILTDVEKATWIHDAIEKETIDEAYWYETMQKELDDLNGRVEDLEDTLVRCGYEEAV